jgi:hypothetical protein
VIHRLGHPTPRLQGGGSAATGYRGQLLTLC